jgi:hypothetical protein
MMDFGELRSQLADRQDSQGWALVWQWAEQVWEVAPKHFEAKWLPCLIEQVGRWRASVCDCPAPWKRHLLAGRFGPMQPVRAPRFQQVELWLGRLSLSSKQFEHWHGALGVPRWRNVGVRR